ncbi:MAG: TetR/AcrR family transcriptional regulator [Solirubrobacteraceae bacterium]
MPRNVPFEQRSRQVIEAASAIVKEAGLAEATTRRIAERAGAPLGSLHYTFRNKEELVEGVYALWMETAGDQIAEVVPEGCGLETGIRAVMSGFFERNAADAAARAAGIAEWELFVWGLRASSAPNIGRQIYEQYRAIVISALTRAAGDSAKPDQIKDLANFICCAVDGTLIKLLALNDAPAARADLNRFIELAVQLARDEL